MSLQKGFNLRDDILPEPDILMRLVFSAAYSEAAMHINMNKK